MGRRRRRRKEVGAAAAAAAAALRGRPASNLTFKLLLPKEDTRTYTRRRDEKKGREEREEKRSRFSPAAAAAAVFFLLFSCTVKRGRRILFFGRVVRRAIGILRCRCEKRKEGRKKEKPHCSYTPSFLPRLACVPLGDSPWRSLNGQPTAAKQSKANADPPAPLDQQQQQHLHTLIIDAASQFSRGEGCLFFSSAPCYHTIITSDKSS